MDTFVKNAYDAGVQQAMVDFGLTKESNILKAIGEAGSGLLRRGGLRAQGFRTGPGGVPMGGVPNITQMPRNISPLQAAVGNPLLRGAEWAAQNQALAGGLGLGAGALGTAGLGYGAYEGLRDPTMMERLEGFAGNLGLG